MTIGFLADTIFPAMGGNGRVPERLAVGLVERGHRVFAYTGRARQRSEPEAAVHVRKFRSLLVPHFRLPARWAWATPSELARAFAADGIEVLHVSTLYSPFGRSALRACRRTDIPLIAHNQSQPEHLLVHFGLQDQRWIVGRIYRYLVSIYERADAVIVASVRDAELLRLWGLKKVPVVLPNGLDLTFWTPYPPHPEFVRRERLEEASLVLCASRLMRDKNLPLLIEAFAQVLRSHSSAVLALVGDGPDRPRLERMARALGVQNHVRFPGWLTSFEDLREWYRAARVFVLPSTVEIQSLSLLEAMACGKPVITARARTNLSTELVRDGENGYLAAPNDPDDLAARLDQLLRDEALCERLGSASRAFVERDHDQGRLLKQLEAFDASFLSRRKPDARIPVARLRGAPGTPGAARQKLISRDAEG